MVASNNAISNTIGASITGVTNTLTVTNPSDTASSAARETITVGGASAGDPSLNFNVSGVTDWEMGIDNGSSDTLKISQGTTLGTNDTWIMTTAGERTMPLQPCFLARLPGGVANVTGDGTLYPIIFSTEDVDQNSDYDNTTGIFTAPVTGNYQFNGNIQWTGAGVGINGIIVLNATSGAWKGNQFTLSQVGFPGNCNYVLSVLIQMDAADTAQIKMEADGGAKTVGLKGDTYGNLFSGYLVC